MTVIAGFPYANGEGILLCSDSEHTGAEEKRFRHKVLTSVSPIGTAAFAYTGHMLLARSAITKCARAMRDCSNTDRALFDVVSETLEQEYTEKILQVPKHSSDDSYWYGLVVALWSKKDAELSLYYADGLVMDLQERPVYSGSGGAVAECLMKNLYWTGIELRQLILSATYMLFRTKQSSAGVSGPSAFLTLRKDGSLSNAGDWLFPERYEQALKGFDGAVGNLLFSVMDRDLEHPDFERRLDGVLNDMRRMRTECRGNSTQEQIEKFLRKLGL
jgi:hypothetical protein